MQSLDKLSFKNHKIFSDLDEADFQEATGGSFHLFLQSLEMTLLNAGDILMKEGESSDFIYLVASGELEAYTTLPSGKELVYGTLESGELIGEMQILLGQKAQASVRVVSDCLLASFSHRQFESLAQKSPKLGDYLSATVRRRMRANQIVKLLTLHFGELSTEALNAFLTRAEWVTLNRGEKLFHQGDPGDSLYVMVGGRLNAVLEEEQPESSQKSWVHSPKHGPPTVWFNISRGELVGEMSLFSGAPRQASAYAQRDSVLVRYSREVFEQLLQEHPVLLPLLVKQLFERFRHRQVSKSRSSNLKNIVVVPLHDNIPIRDFSSLLEQNLQILGSTFLATERVMKAHLGSAIYRAFQSHNSPQSLWLDLWLEEQEASHRFVLFEAEHTWSPWTQKCVREADVVLFVGWGDGDVGLSEVERQVRELAGTVSVTRQELVLLHPKSTSMPSGTQHWLAPRQLYRHHHLRWGNEGDMARLARFMADRAIGLVMGGGGARGAAHIGVLKALQERGIPIDFIGATSAGAMVGAQYAMGSPLSQIEAQSKRLLIEEKPFRDYTLPIFSILGHRRFNRAIRHAYGNTIIEDLWINFFCVSCNIGTGDKIIHREGSLWKAIRSSSSVPGLMPPFLDKGQLHVDGAVVENLPAHTMKSMNPGPLIVVDVGFEDTMAVNEAWKKLPSPWRVFWSWINPFHTTIRVPWLIDIMMQSTMIGSVSRRKHEIAIADLFLCPHMDINTYGFLSFHLFDDIVRLGYEDTRKSVLRWQPPERPITFSYDDLPAFTDPKRT